MSDSPPVSRAIDDLEIAPPIRQAVLEQLIAALDSYVFPEIARRIQQDVRDRLASDGYSDVTAGRQLADTLTAQLQALSQDPQLRLHFSPQRLPTLEPAVKPAPDDLERQRRLSSLRNFDFNRVERLRGNVGYIQLFGFEPPEFAGDTAAAAMNFVAHTQALIFDLRHNSGGAPAMVALLCSYLLPAYPSVHLNDLYWPQTEETRQWWSLPYVAGQRYVDKSVFVLTSPETASAAEEFAYNLQVLKRATIVGETTRGGANPGRGHRLHDHFWMFIPSGRAINPITHTNWHGSGVVPDAKVPSELALNTAHLIALNQLLETATGSHRRELEAAAQAVDKELQQQRQDLISRLGGTV